LRRKRFNGGFDFSKRAHDLTYLSQEMRATTHRQMEARRKRFSVLLFPLASLRLCSALSAFLPRVEARGQRFCARVVSPRSASQRGLSQRPQRRKEDGLDAVSNPSSILNTYCLRRIHAEGWEWNLPRHRRGRFATTGDFSRSGVSGARGLWPWPSRGR
jgi:hypothetical protein